MLQLRVVLGEGGVGGALTQRRDRHVLFLPWPGRSEGRKRVQSPDRSSEEYLTSYLP
ncbi:hypothetical protein Cme02nite_55130 [Catellatospora methionotrophica]|uniref:Uncharacterized protein n=1 Tax=Catellatospora methionotrophica TaxID=121620 RepID=A0A8J3LL58_9ACTN|nr:hypothetical protein Cme02nite_55130 [Catellatospora methionotrophica]